MTPAPQLFDTAPSWFQSASKEIGTHEDAAGTNTGPNVQRYIDLAHCGAQGEPWCAVFTNAMLEKNGIKGTRSPGSQSFRNDPNFVKLAGPARGAIAVFWRQSIHSGLGHVGFYYGERGDHVWVLGGNEGDMVQIEAFPKVSGSFGLVGYWWPASVPLPKLGAVLMPQGAPSHQTKVT